MGPRSAKFAHLLYENENNLTNGNSKYSGSKSPKKVANYEDVVNDLTAGDKEY
jgi:hypothetical protein